MTSGHLYQSTFIRYRIKNWSYFRAGTVPPVNCFNPFFRLESQELRNVITLAPYHPAGLRVVRVEGSTPNDPVSKPSPSLLHPWSSGQTRSLEGKVQGGLCWGSAFSWRVCTEREFGVWCLWLQASLSFQGFTFPLSDLGRILAYGSKSTPLQTLGQAVTRVVGVWTDGNKQHKEKRASASGSGIQRTHIRELMITISSVLPTQTMLLASTFKRTVFRLD